MKGPFKLHSRIFDPGAATPPGTAPIINYHIAAPGGAQQVPTAAPPVVQEPTLGQGKTGDRLAALEVESVNNRNRQAAQDLEVLRQRMIIDAQHAGHRFVPAMVAGANQQEIDASIKRAIETQLRLEKEAELRAEQGLIARGLFRPQAPTQPQQPQATQLPVGYSSAPVAPFPQPGVPQGVPQFRAPTDPGPQAQPQGILPNGLSPDMIAYLTSPAAMRDAVVDPQTGRMGLSSYEKYRHLLMGAMQQGMPTPQFPAQYSMAPPYIPQQALIAGQPTYGPPPMVNPTAMLPNASPMPNGYQNNFAPQMPVQAQPQFTVPQPQQQFAIPQGYTLAVTPQGQQVFIPAQQQITMPQQMPVQQTFQNGMLPPQPGQTVGTQSDAILGQQLAAYHQNTGAPIQNALGLALGAAQAGVMRSN